MKVFKTARNLQKALGASRVALVPTMGSIHEGHLSLVDIARQHCDLVVVSLFVNPAQFSPQEDFGRYPRSFEQDRLQLERRGTDFLFAPQKKEIYPEGFATPKKPPAKISEVLEGSRPHFFGGVVAVVGRLLEICKPHVAVFGKKDYQQLLVVRRFVKKENFQVFIVSAPVVREPDGLAMSSRNAYLSPEERKKAAALYKILCQTAQKICHTKSVKKPLQEGKEEFCKAGFDVDYLSLRHGSSFKTLSAPHPEGRLLAAVWLGQTRLIDNIALSDVTRATL